MSITHSRLKKFPSFDLVNAHFIHHKLIIQEDTEKVRICDLTARTEEDPDNNKVYNFDAKISNTHVHGELLWVLLRSGDIIVINPATGTQIKVTCEKLVKYKIQKLRSNENNVILISKSGECLVVLFSRKDLEQDIVDGKAEHTISIDKYGGSYLAVESHLLTNGLIAYIEGETLVLKCPLTGLYEVMSSTKKILYAVPWADSLIISDGETMWLVDIKDSHIMYEFKEDGITYYPLGSYNNDFYYLVWDQMQVYVCCAWDESLLLDATNDQRDNNSTIQKLSSQETLKVQLKTIIDSLTSTTDPDQVLPQIQPYFDTIEDLPLLVNMALKLCKINLAFKTLAYSLQKKVFASGDDSLIQSLCDIMNKIDILEYIEFRGSNLYEDLSIFDLSFVELCMTFVSKGDFDLSSISWLKYSAVKQTINSNDIMGILNAIPNNIKMGALINWLRNFLPPLLDENPFYIDLFVRWVTERVFSLEKSSYWPKIGLKFIEDIGIVLEISLKTICLRPISMDDLDMLKTHIKNIIELKEKHKINMLLGELSSQSPSEVALIMLRRCYTEDLEPFLQHYLPSYSARNSFEIDDTLRAFIEIEAASSGGDVDGARLKILLNSFRLHTNKLECFLQVLKVLDVPWNPIVLELAVEAASSGRKDFTTTATDRILAEQIQRELNYAKVKVILKKYKFSLKCTDYQLVLHKLMTAPSINLDDLKVITSALTDYANYGSLLYLNRCLCDCETRAALEYFNQMPSKEKKILLKSVMIKYEQIIKGNSNDAIIERNYVDFLKGSKMLNDLEINTIENMYYLKNSFETKRSINDMYCENSANEADITMNVSDTEMSGCLAQLTRAHQTSRSTLIALLHRTSSNHEVRKLVEALLTAEAQEHCNSQIASVLANFRDGNNSAILMECCHVLTELVSTCTEEHIHCIIKYLSMLTALVNANIVVKNLSIAWKFHYMFLPMSSLSTLNDLIDFYISPHNYLACNPGICHSRGDFIPIRIVVNISEDISSSGKDLPGELLQIRNKICRQLLNKVVASQELDELLITILLDLLSKDEADKMWIIDMLRGQNESLSHAAIAYLAQPVIRRSFSAFCLTQNTVAYSPQYMLKTKFKFNVADLALPEINNDDTWDTKVVLFFFLKQYPETSVERLIELCRTLHIPVNEGLSFQLISLLTTWELKYKIFNDDIGCCQTLFENDESHLLPNCVKLWESIKDKDFIKDVLTDLWKNGEVTLHGRIVSINPYYYEVYLCIYNLLYGSSTDSEYVKEYYLLNFLKNYNRKSAPKQHEFELFSVKGMFPEIGHHRLPFHLFMREDMWANLKSEITLETYEQWLPAVALLSLDADIQTARDMICSNALKQTMTSRKKSEGLETEQKESEPWRLTTREEPLLRAAHRCVKHIANMEWAGACLFYVLQGCARGADQVAAAQLCYQFAQRWSAVQPGNRAVRQMERLHSTLSTRHILHKVEWACEEFVRLSTEPTQLIRNLYLHPNFVEKISRHDINRAANEIADKNAINISSIRIEILENILEKSKEENKNKTSFGLDNKDLTTAKYILKATCPKMGAIYLSRIALDDENDYNKSKKLRALQCLMSIIDSDTASKVTNRERDSLWNTLLELLYIVNLEHIDMPWIVATFMNDKLGALDQLLQAVGGNVEGLKITGELAWRYGNIKIIQKVIPSVLRAGLYDELVPLLLKVASATDKTVCDAWRTVLLSPFQQADYPITERQRAKCLNAVNLLPVCPVIRDADLIEIWKNCVRCKCFGIGCLLLPYMTTESRQMLSELQKIDRRNLIASLKNLQTETYLVPGAMHVLESMASRSYGRSQKT
ncbi:uncharacterized protein LOC134790004 [Cydia splendana]|uniref:uncharacterized protein LOC134790004 n=1 Tax=Cydia splendana TaxID=1100963 RepID=UPI002136E9AE